MSGKGLSSNDAARLEQSFAVGLSRSPAPAVDSLSGATDATLAALSLLAQQKRFRRPMAGSPSIAPFLPEDDRPVLPEAARPILRQLLAGPEAHSSDPIAKSAAQIMRLRGIRYHPFDLPWLQAHLRNLNEHGELGPTERFWLRRDGARPAADLHLLVITDDNWTEFKKAERETFLRRRRSEDPAGARRLLEACIAGESASVRATLVSALGVRIGPDDRAFLEGLAGDRAKSVRDEAEALLGSIPGTEEYTTRREKALSLIEAKRGGLMSRKLRLSFRGIARGRSPDGEVRDAQVALSGVTLADLSERFGCPIEALLPAAVDDRPLYSVMLTAAAQEGRWPLLQEWASSRNGHWDDLLPAINAALYDLPIARRGEIAKELIARTGVESLGDWIALAGLRMVLEGPLDDASARLLLSSRGWKSLLAALAADTPKPRDIETLRAVATLIPSSLVGPFIAAIEHLPREIALRPTLYHRFLAALDTQNPS